MIRDADSGGVSMEADDGGVIMEAVEGGLRLEEDGVDVLEEEEPDDLLLFLSLAALTEEEQFD